MKNLRIAILVGLITLSTNAQYINQKDNTGCEKLLKAVMEEDISNIKKLLKTVDANCTYAIHAKKTSVTDGGYSFLAEGPRTPLVGAERTGNLAIGKLLIAAKAEVKFHATNDETPLMAAAKNGHLDFVAYLVEKGAEVNKKLAGDGTALLVASREGHKNIVQYLISKEAEINALVSSDGTSLIQSVKHGHYEIAKLLLENGADPNLESPGDEYPIYHALETNNKNMIALLEKYGTK